MTLNQETGLYGPYDFMYEPFFTKPWFIALLISLVILLVVLIGYIVYRIIRSYQEGRVTPLMRAEKALSVLATKCADIKDTPVSMPLEQVVIIFKRYWQEAMGQEVVQCTPKEFSFLLRHYCSHADVKNKIDEFFDSLEYFLFAHHESSCADVERIVHQASILLKKIDSDRLSKKC